MFKSLLYLDRYRNEGTRTYSRHADYTEALEIYQPNSKHPHFDLSVFEVPLSQLKIYTANPSIELSDIYIGDETALFCIHPQVLENFQDDLYVKHILSTGNARAGIKVSPSSSTRTLYVHNDQIQHAIKVHFPFRISRYGRKMRDEVLEQAANVSKELEGGIHHLDDRFAFLREVIAVVHKNLQPDLPRGENWGYLVRDMKPFPIADDRRYLIPGFSLYGKDFFDANNRPLLFDIIEDSDPKEYILSNIMFPIIRHWVGCFNHFGYLLEPHGQNVLLEVAQDRQIKRIVHRDLSIGIDIRRRREIKLTSDNLNAYNRMENNEFHSITYDKFMGGHFFDRIVATCREKYPNLKAEDFRKPCRDEFARIFPDWARHFPRTVCYFSEKRDQFDKPLSHDTGKAPVWRP